MRNRLLALSIVALCGGCESTAVPTAPASAPAPTLAPSPAPASNAYRVSGRVIDDSGAGIAGARVWVTFYNMVSTDPQRSNADGSYDITFTSDRPLLVDPELIGFVIAYDERGSSSQRIPLGAHDVVQHLRLRPTRTITAGESSSVLVDADSSNCFNEDYWQTSKRCAWLGIEVPSTGTLLVSASADGIVPDVDSDYYPTTRSPGAASIGVVAGHRYVVRFEIPHTRVPQHVAVTTSLQP